MKKLMAASIGLTLLSGAAMFAQNTSSDTMKSGTKMEKKHKKGKKGETSSTTTTSTSK